MQNVVFLIITLLTAASAVAGDVQFNRDIRPLLADRCFHCHGPDEADRQAGLRLDRADTERGAHASAIVPGSSEESELFARIISDDPDVIMPPPDSHKKPLTDDEKELFRQWIDQGGEYEEFWAFMPPEMPFLPEDMLRAGVQPIDLLVGEALKREGRTPAVQADKRTLIRRVSLDLTGMPPSREEIRFVSRR